MCEISHAPVADRSNATTSPSWRAEQDMRGRTSPQHRATTWFGRDVPHPRAKHSVPPRVFFDRIPLGWTKASPEQLTEQVSNISPFQRDSRDDGNIHCAACPPRGLRPLAVMIIWPRKVGRLKSRLTPGSRTANGPHRVPNNVPATSGGGTKRPPNRIEIFCLSLFEQGLAPCGSMDRSFPLAFEQCGLRVPHTISSHRLTAWNDEKAQCYHRHDRHKTNSEPLLARSAMSTQKSWHDAQASCKRKETTRKLAWFIAACVLGTNTAPGPRREGVAAVSKFRRDSGERRTTSAATSAPNAVNGVASGAWPMRSAMAPNPPPQARRGRRRLTSVARRLRCCSPVAANTSAP